MAVLWGLLTLVGTLVGRTQVKIHTLWRLTLFVAAPSHWNKLKMHLISVLRWNSKHIHLGNFLIPSSTFYFNYIYFIPILFCCPLFSFICFLLSIVKHFASLLGHDNGLYFVYFVKIMCAVSAVTSIELVIRNEVQDAISSLKDNKTSSP